MHIREELQITRPLEPGHEVALALLLTREYVARLFDEWRAASRLNGENGDVG